MASGGGWRGGFEVVGARFGQLIHGSVAVSVGMSGQGRQAWDDAREVDGWPTDGWEARIEQRVEEDGGGRSWLSGTAAKEEICSRGWPGVGEKRGRCRSGGSEVWSPTAVGGLMVGEERKL